MMQRLLPLLLILSPHFAFAATATSAATTSKTAMALPKRESFKDVRNAISLGLYGSGQVYTVNFERLMNRKVVLGLGYSTLSMNAKVGPADAFAKVDIIPLYMNYYFPFSEHRPFVGGSLMIFKVKAQSGFDLNSILPEISIQDAEGKKTSLTKFTTDTPAITSEVNAYVTIPVVQGGYEYRNTDGALLRIAAGIGLFNSKTYPLMSFVGGVGF